MRIVVSGAAGFIGSHLVDRLLAEEHSVIGLDNLITGSTRNLAHLESDSRFRFIRHDVTEPFEHDAPVDAVLHLASLASPKDYLAHPIETLEVGSTGTRNMLELARQHGARFLLTSTSECYGDPLVHPQAETYWGNVNPVGLRSCYDESKRYAEALTMAYHRVHGVRTNIARIFNTYGPRMQLDDGRVVPAFIDQALHGVPLTVYGDGKQTRSFCYVSDLVEGLHRLMFSEERFPVNLGNPAEMTILEFAEAVQKVAGSNLPIRHESLPEDDPKRRRPDISKARRCSAGSPACRSKKACDEPGSISGTCNPNSGCILFGIMLFRLILGATLASSVAHGETYDFARLAGDLIDLEALARVDFLPTRMVSSFDRTGGNNDALVGAWRKGDLYTIAELEGPGVIRRFYSARPGGHLRIYIDGGETPVVDMKCEEFFSGRHYPFARPLVGPWAEATIPISPSLTRNPSRSRPPRCARPNSPTAFTTK